MTRKNEAGNVVIFVTLALGVLLGFAGLAIDMGMLRYEQRLQQTAADAAAIAGANNLAFGGAVTTGAQNAAAANLFTDNGGGQVSNCGPTAAVGTICVQVNNPPQSGPHATCPVPCQYVEVLVAAVQPTYFMTILGVNQETVTARAVAANLSGGATGGGCIYTLGTTPNEIVGVGASGSVTLNGGTCAIVDNGDLDAAQLSITASSIGVGGTYTAPVSGIVTPTPVSGVPYSGDPLANQFPTPSVGPPQADPCAAVLPPNQCAPPAGTYSSITINNNVNAVFIPGGVYAISGGNFTINAGAQVCGGGTANFGVSPMTCTQDAAGDGVTFYLTANASMTVNQTADVEMYAPNSGTTEGILVYQDPSDSQAASLSGNSNSFYQGAIYMPDAQLTFGGNTSFNSGAQYTVIDVLALQLSGNPDVNLNSNYLGLANGGGPLVGAITSATLVE